MKTQPYNAAGADGDCELLCPLFTGATGVVQLGKVLTGKDAGRLVMLRPVSARTAASVKVLVDRVRQINHPRLLKVVGCFRSGPQHYVASDYISGVSFVELGPALSPSDPVAVGVAVRVMRDTLVAAHSGRRLLQGIYGYCVERCVYPDTIWIADFGKAFLSELAVFEAVLGDPKHGASGVRGLSYRVSEDSGSEDVLAAGNLLFEILSRDSGQRGSRFALSSTELKALANVVTTALSKEQGHGYENAGTMAEALAKLPPAFDVSDQTIRLCVSQALGPVLEQRRERLVLVDKGPERRISGWVPAQSTQSVRTDVSSSEPPIHSGSTKGEYEDETTLWIPPLPNVEAPALHETPRRSRPPGVMIIWALLLILALVVIALVGY